MELVSQILAYAPQAWLVAFSRLMLSNGVSFVANFLLARERQRLGVRSLMFAPYGRIVIMHCVVLLGGAAVMALGQALAMLLLLVALKLGMDIILHLREHGKTARK